MDEIRLEPPQALTKDVVRRAVDASFGGKATELTDASIQAIASLYANFADVPWTYYDHNCIISRWAALMVQPLGAQVREITRADLERDDMRRYLALAFPSGVIDSSMLPDVHLEMDRRSTADFLCDILDIDRSTLYRIQNRARIYAVERILDSIRTDARWFDTLVNVVCTHVYHCSGFSTRDLRVAWHIQRASLLEAGGHPIAMAWHLLRAEEWDALGIRLHMHIFEAIAHSQLAPLPDMKKQIHCFVRASPKLHQKVRLQRVLAIVHEVEGDSGQRSEAHELALRLAHQSKQALPLANAFHDLALFSMWRDADLTESYFRRSIEAFERVANEPAWAEDYCYALINYALWQSYKFNASSIGLLRRADALSIPPICQARANLSYLWGMVETRIGNLGDALRHYYDATAIYQALNDRINLRLIQVNIGIAYLSMNRYSEALRAFDRALDGEDLSRMSDANLAHTYQMRAEALRFLGRFEDAFVELEKVAALTSEDDLKIRAEMFDSLARLYYKTWQESGRLEQRIAFEHTCAELEAAANLHPTAKALLESLRRDLAAEEVDGRIEQLQPPERAEHHIELSEIDRLRQQTVSDPEPASQLSARLGIARIYLELSIKERQNALALAEEHNLLASTTEAVLAMADRHERTLDSRDRLISRWQERSGLDVALIQSVLAHFEQHGKLTKKAYISLSGVSAATASRVLARLVDAGLIVTQGAGASIHYTRASL